MRFLRVIRLDDSDEQTFPVAARAGELAVTGSFAFTYSDADPARLKGRERQAFRNGFLGVDTFGWSTLVQVADISDDEYQHVVDRLAEHFVLRYGAPHVPAARPHASVEAEYAMSLCEHPAGTLLAVEREAAGGQIREKFRVVRPEARWEGDEVKVWRLVPED